jgi:hypothetical protein
MSEEKKPCSHCGGNHLRFERWIHDDNEYRSFKIFYRVFCETCLYAPNNWEDTPEKAIQYWNTRPIEDALRARAEAAKADAEHLAEVMRQVRIENHRECEDGWYSCTKHEGYFGEGDRTECDCGKDENNAVIDAALAAHDAAKDSEK